VKDAGVGIQLFVHAETPEERAVIAELEAEVNRTRKFYLSGFTRTCDGNPHPDGFRFGTYKADNDPLVRKQRAKAEQDAFTEALNKSREESHAKDRQAAAEPAEQDSSFGSYYH
jgi:hypothetical protein